MYRMLLFCTFAAGRSASGDLPFAAAHSIQSLAGVIKGSDPLIPFARASRSRGRGRPRVPEPLPPGSTDQAPTQHRPISHRKTADSGERGIVLGKKKRDRHRCRSLRIVRYILDIHIDDCLVKLLLS